MVARVSELNAGFKYTVLDDIIQKLGPQVLVKNAIVNKMVTKMDKNPAYGDILNNLDLFKIQKKCFNSINWSPRVSTSHMKKLEKKVRQFQVITHTNAVTKRRKSAEQARVAHIQEDIRLHQERMKEFKKTEGEKCKGEHEGIVTQYLQNYIKNNIQDEEYKNSIVELHRDAIKHQNPISHAIA